MIEIMAVSGEAAEEMNQKIQLILDAAMPPFQAELDRNVQLNAIGMMLAMVLRGVHPDQQAEFISAFECITRVHLEEMNQLVARKTTTAFFDLVRNLFEGKKPGDDTTH